LAFSRAAARSSLAWIALSMAAISRTLSALILDQAREFGELECTYKANPYHDEKGRFAPGPGGGAKPEPQPSEGETGGHRYRPTHGGGQHAGVDPRRRRARGGGAWAQRPKSAPRNATGLIVQGCRAVVDDNVSHLALRPHDPVSDKRLRSGQGSGLGMISPLHAMSPRLWVP
jgi:hypothetical protein